MLLYISGLIIAFLVFIGETIGGILHCFFKFFKIISEGRARQVWNMKKRSLGAIFERYCRITENLYLEILMNLKRMKRHVIFRISWKKGPKHG